MIFKNLSLIQHLNFLLFQPWISRTLIICVITNIMFPSPRALAAEVGKKVVSHRGVVLKWKGIPGADFYRIEISSTMDFSDPDMVVQVRGLKYFWTGFKSNQIYYFRVAAGADDGVKGPFSPPRKVDLAAMVFKPNQVKGP